MSERYHYKGDGIWYDTGSEPAEFDSDDVINIYPDAQMQCVTVVLQDGTKVVPDFTTGGNYIEEARVWYGMIIHTTTGCASLPEPAQKLITGCHVPYRVALDIMQEVKDCQSPIEEILYVALKIAGYSRRDEFRVHDTDGEVVGSYLVYIMPQFEINTNGKKYYADFRVLSHYADSENIFDDYCVPEIGSEISFIVECDGHDYHHTSRDQIQHDYERERDIKMAGFDVLRFTGSQIFNDPYKCANDVLDYIEVKIAG